MISYQSIAETIIKIVGYPIAVGWPICTWITGWSWVPTWAWWSGGAVLVICVLVLEAENNA